MQRENTTSNQWQPMIKSTNIQKTWFEKTFTGNSTATTRFPSNLLTQVLSASNYLQLDHFTKKHFCKLNRQYINASKQKTLKQSALKRQLISILLINFQDLRNPTDKFHYSIIRAEKDKRVLKIKVCRWIPKIKCRTKLSGICTESQNLSNL